jgi:hypothetical protein
LENWLDLVFIVEEIRISFKNLRGLGLTLSIGNEDSGRRSIDEVVGLDLLLWDKVIAIAELFPVVGPSHLLHLNVLIALFFTLALPLPLLDKSALTHLILTLLHIGLLHSLLFD